MQFCPRCGAQNQDDRASCWKCFGQIQKPDSKKAQHIVMSDKDSPTAGIHATAESPAEEPVIAPVPIPELADIEPEPEPVAPAPDLGPSISEPEPEAAAEPAPQVASLGDVMIPSPSFGSGESEDDEVPAQPSPILGLVNLDAEEPSRLDLDAQGSEPVYGLGGLSEDPLVVQPADDSQSAEGTDESPLPWWMTQDDSEDATADAKDKSTIDLDDGGLEFISLDDEDPNSKKSPPDV